MLKAEQAVLTLTIYRPPNWLSVFLSEFSQLVALIITNVDCVHFKKEILTFILTTVLTDEFMNLLESLELTQHVTEATHQHVNILNLIVSKGLSIDDVSVTMFTCTKYILKICFHSYADDIQLYITVEPSDVDALGSPPYTF